MGEKEDLDLELDEKAQVIAEATGRTKEAVLEDLMDDGIVNLSNEEKKDASLVEQLKEAAELIATVQMINSQVSENTVLNGGQNKTEVAVETTLEGDIVDRAIASVERKAEKIRKIAVIIAPIMLLLSGGIGFEYFLDNNGGGDTDYVEVWGCMDYNALNYDEAATDDDGSCYWDDNNGGGGGPPCPGDWRWDDVIIRDVDWDGSGYNNDLEISVLFNDWQNCDRHMQGHFLIQVTNEDTGEQYDSHQIDEKFHDEYQVEYDLRNLPEGEWFVKIDYYFEDSSWSGPSALVTMESPECDDDIVVNQLVLSNNGNDLNLYVEFQDNNDCGGDIEMKISFYKNGQYTNNQYLAANNYRVHEDGQTYFNINQDDTDFMNDVEDGDWKIGFRWYIVGEEENCCDMSNTVTVDEIPDTTPCDADIDNLQATVSDDDVDIIFYIAQHEDTDCEDWDIEIILIPVDDNEEEELIHEHSISESSNYYSHTFEEVPNGDWQAEVTLSQNENCASDCEITGDATGWFIVDYSEEEEICEINLFGITLNIQNTTAYAAYDLDCGYDTNDLEGYNVSTQLVVYPHGQVTQQDILNYTVGFHYIQGYTDDVRILSVGNFADANTTHYDFFWYAIWEDGNGTQRVLEHSWLNQEIIVASEPQCNNLTITSNSLVLSKDSNEDLVMAWNLSHGGPSDPTCFIPDVQISITIYQDGQYYNISDFQDNGAYEVHANADGNYTLVLTSDEVDLFADLPPGTYEILVKYRIGDTGTVSSDHFANSVGIS